MVDFDVIIVGAGLSGIGAAAHLQRRCPGKTYTVLEARGAIGGTWDLFRYPGIRSDSDMFTFGYSFRPWRSTKAISEGGAILEYIRDTAREEGIEPHIRFNHAVEGAAWANNQWTVRIKGHGPLTCRFLFVCSGYYDYDTGHDPEFAGRADFKGTVVHPQHWPKDLDYKDKRVVVIGSGATAITIVPEMAKTAAHVTMLQRSPTYVVSLPAEDPLAKTLQANLPAMWAYNVTRWKNILMHMAFYQFCRRYPERARKLIRKGVIAAAGPEASEHFNPSYDPWDQRLCLVPDNDLFTTLKQGRASMVTDHIDRFTSGGVLLKSGRQLDADIIVTATGLKLKVLGGATLEVDGERIHPPSRFTYKGCMVSGVPNFAFAVGYTNAPWTLKCDLASEFVCRVLKRMDRTGHDVVVPTPKNPNMRHLPLIDFKSGYVERAQAILPQQGERSPWRLYQNYLLDLVLFRMLPLDDGALAFHDASRDTHSQPEPRGVTQRA